jgi:choice-of-anchor A domain-containing protein
MRESISGLLALIASLVTAAAHASPIPVATLLTDFNVITNSNFTTTNDVVGPVLIGGNLRDTSIINDAPVVPLPIPVAGLGEVNVFGNVVGTTVATIPSVGAGSVVLIGGSNPTPPSLVQATFPGKGAGSVLSGNSFPFNFANDIWAQLNGTTGLSHSLAGLTANSSQTGSTFTGTANANGVAVFTVPLTTLNGLTNPLMLAGCLALATPCDAVINVTGAGSFTQGFNWGTIGTPQQNLIFNFEDASSLTINNQWFSSILAPLADIENSAAINGNVVANTVGAAGSLGGEIHNFAFDCSDHLCDLTTVMPEPGSLAVLGSALVAGAALRHRRRRAG